MENHWHKNFVVDPDTAKYLEKHALVESTEIDIFGSYVITRNGAKILPTLGIPALKFIGVEKPAFYNR